MNYTHIICHYGEIGIKGDNRRYFEQKLRENIKAGLKAVIPAGIESVNLMPGRIMVSLESGNRLEVETAAATLKKIFGIVHFSFASAVELDLEIIKAAALVLVAETKPATFRITTIRSQKNFSMNSQEINRFLGDAVVEKFGLKVNLTEPELNLHVEIVNNKAYLFAQKFKGAGGLPVGASGKALAFLSGGIDSPVAAYYLLKRGAPLEYIHFHSMPFTSRESVDKVKELARVLMAYGGRNRIHMVPFAEAQKQILTNAPAKLRVILYRRMMMRIGERLARQENCLAFVTGESLGQVASQTMENMGATGAVAGLPIFRPLVGFDKDEIMAKAREIGTYDLSILPHDDCCVRFIPEHPETKAKLAEVEAAERELDTEGIVAEAIRNTLVEMV